MGCEAAEGSSVLVLPRTKPKRRPAAEFLNRARRRALNKVPRLIARRLATGLSHRERVKEDWRSETKSERKDESSLGENLLKLLEDILQCDEHVRIPKADDAESLTGQKIRSLLVIFDAVEML